MLVRPCRSALSGVVDAVRHHARLYRGVAERKTDRVEAQRFHLVHHALVTAGPQAVHDAVARLEAEPVDAGDSDRTVRGVEDLVAARMKEAGAGGRPGGGHGDAVGGDRGELGGPVQRVVRGVRRRLAGRGVEAEVHAAAVGDGTVVSRVLEDIVRAGVAHDGRVPDVRDCESGVEREGPVRHVGRPDVGDRDAAGESGAPVVAVDERDVGMNRGDGRGCGAGGRLEGRARDALRGGRPRGRVT